MSEIKDIKEFYDLFTQLLLDEKFRNLKQKKQFNIFDVLKIARAEIRHSNVLAWLLDPNEDHGLGNRVLNEFVLMLVKNGYADGYAVRTLLLAKYEEVMIYREKNNIDILIESVKDKFVICIENKVDTKDHDEQLSKYYKLVDKEYAQYQKVFLYLTPNGDQPTEENTAEWSCIDYQGINECITH